MSSPTVLFVPDPVYTGLAQEAFRTPLTHENLVNLAVKSMQTIGAQSNLTGPQKKQWVLAAVTQIVKDHPLADAATKSILLDTVVNVIAPFIDHLVAAAQGAYTFYTEMEASGLFSSCCGGSSSNTPVKK